MNLLALIEARMLFDACLNVAPPGSWDSDASAISLPVSGRRVRPARHTSSRSRSVSGWIT
jgi:hypothetical protein